MSKETYLSLLRTYLTGRLPAGEVEDILRYYTEYFAEAGVGQEQAVINELGSPEALSHQILSERNWEEPGLPPEYPQYDCEAEYQPAADWRIPNWTFFLLVGAALFFGWPVALALVLGLGGAGIICIGVGIGVACSAFTRFTFAGAIYEAGGGLMAVSVGVLLLCALVALCRLASKGIRYLWDVTVE